MQDLAHAELLGALDDADDPPARREGLAGLEAFAAIDALAKTLEELKKRAMRGLRPVITQRLLARAKLDRGRPKGFMVGEGQARATVSLRRRPSSRPLSLSEIEALAKARVTPKAPARRVQINPRYVDDQVTLAALARLVAANPGVLPPDFFQNCKPEIVVDDELLERVLLLGETATDLVEIVADVGLTRPELDIDAARLSGLAQKAVDRLLGLPPPPERPTARLHPPSRPTPPARQQGRDTPALLASAPVRRGRPRPAPA